MYLFANGKGPSHRVVSLSSIHISATKKGHVDVNLTEIINEYISEYMFRIFPKYDKLTNTLKSFYFPVQCRLASICFKQSVVEALNT